jgi:hypothetical protein
MADEPAANDFDKIFLRYVAELRGALAAAQAWWAELEQSERAKFSTEKQAAASVEARWPFGPSSHPWVLGVYRKYYLLTEELNARNQSRQEPEREQPETEADWGEEDLEPADLGLDGDESPFTGMSQVTPWILLLDSLLGRDDDLAEALEFLVYRPVGLDENDHVV